MTTQLKQKTDVGHIDAVANTPATKSKTKRSQRTPAELAAERKLIRAVQAGDKLAFEKLVRSYEQKVFWIAHNLVNHTEDARDIAQESFLRVYKAIDRFDLKYNFYTWLYRIVVNLAIDRLRKKGKQNAVSIEEFPTDPATNQTPEDHMRHSETGEKIFEVLDAMPDKYKTVILLRDLHEMSCEEISEIIECTNATTRWRLHRAREMFKERWARIVV
ncbi:MAG: sigma-70 family RNA polymerase sigma factor [Planctomycetota bacterium]